MKMIHRAGAALLALVMMTSGVSAVSGETAEEETDPVAAETAVDPAPTEEPAEDWRLLLVNPWNPLPENYTVTLKRLANGLRVDERIYADLEDMLSDCWAAGLRPVVCSAYRTHATQIRLHNNKIARLRAAGYSRDAAVKEAGRWVAVPGTSEHETGMALDLVSSRYQGLTARQADTAEQKWFLEHCWEYGFILRYPADKTEITGIGYEPWHYRYVGRETAARMRETGLCLEEYLALLTAEAAETDPAGEEPLTEEGLPGEEPAPMEEPSRTQETA